MNRPSCFDECSFLVHTIFSLFRLHSCFFASSPNSAGYMPTQNDQFSWTLSFPTANSFQVCVFRLATPMAWSDASLKFKWSYATTSTVCAAGQYIDAAFQCQACPAGSYGGASPQSSPACSGPCSAGMYAYYRPLDFVHSVLFSHSLCPFSCRFFRFMLAGYFCPSGSTSATQYACVSGSYCPSGASSQIACAFGSVCANTTSQIACASGQYCSTTGLTASSGVCAPGFYCAAGSAVTAHGQGIFEFYVFASCAFRGFEFCVHLRLSRSHSPREHTGWKRSRWFVQRHWCSGIDQFSGWSGDFPLWCICSGL